MLGAPPLRLCGHAVTGVERKRIEEALRASEERWHRVFDSSAIPMALADGNRRIAAVNSACEKMLGLSAREIVSPHPDGACAYMLRRYAVGVTPSMRRNVVANWLELLKPLLRAISVRLSRRSSISSLARAILRLIRYRCGE